jgi:hypothetical protein
MRHWLPAIIGLSLSCVSFDALSKDWELVSSSSLNHFVLVDASKATNRRFFENIADELCVPSKYCYVLFWTDPRMVARKLPMSDAQADALVANFANNPSTKHRELLLHCRIDPNPDQCFR